MSEIERMTITMPAEMAAVVKSAVDAGDYASTSEVVRAALRDWKTKRALQIEELAALKADIDAGLADVAAGRVKDFDAARIVERGRKLLAEPLTLRLTQTAEADLAEIWFYVAGEASEATAKRLIDKIKHDCEPLRHFPLTHPRANSLHPACASAFSGNYAIYYVHDEHESCDRSRLAWRA